MDSIRENQTASPPQNNPQPSGSPFLLVMVVVLVFSLILSLIGASFYFLLGKKLVTGSSVRQSKKENRAAVSPARTRVGNLVEEKKNLYFKNIAEAKNLWSQGRYSEVLEKARQALSNAETNQDKAVAHYWIGLAYYKQQDLSAAESQINLALSLFPNYAPPYATLSAIQMDRSDFQKALESAKRCVDLDSTYAWCHNNLGLSLLYLGRKEEGIRELEQAVSLAPDSYVFRDNLTRARQSK